MPARPQPTRPATATTRGSAAASKRPAPARRQTAAAPILLLLLAACGPADAGPEDAERDGVPQGQSAPGAAAERYFEAVSNAEFSKACDLLAPVVRDRYATAGKDCRTELAQLFDEPTRAAIGDVTADESKVRVTGDTAVVPGSALARADLPPGADVPRFPDLRATRQDGIWYLLPE